MQFQEANPQQQPNIASSIRASQLEEIQGIINRSIWNKTSFNVKSRLKWKPTSEETREWKRKVKQYNNIQGEIIAKRQNTLHFSTL